jgi:hypothetical protein
MTPDLSRNSFDALKRFSRVIQQQGRVQLDSDWNEQTDLLLHFARALAVTMLGPHAGPAIGMGFKIGIKPVDNDPTKLAELTIGLGSYFVGGLYCENLQDGMTFTNQPDLRITAKPEQALLPPFPFLVFLDAWEAPVTALDDPSIREVALGGPDTAARMRIGWRVRVAGIDATPIVFPPGSGVAAKPPKDIIIRPATAPGDLANLVFDRIVPHDLRQIDLRRAAATRLLASISAADAAALKAAAPSEICRLKVALEDTDTSAQRKPCTIHPDAKYRGLENQLYRVEVHSGGSFAPEPVNPGDPKVEGGPIPTFKWSRENGAVAYSMSDFSAQGDAWVATLDDLGRDERFGLSVGDWVEVVDDDSAHAEDAPGMIDIAAPAIIPPRTAFAGARPRDLMLVDEVDPITDQVTLNFPKGTVPDAVTVAALRNLLDPGLFAALKPKLRRWDQKAGAIETSDKKLPLGAIEIKEPKDHPKPDPSPDKPKHLEAEFVLEDGIVIQFQRTNRTATITPDGSPASYRTAIYRPGDYWLIPARSATSTILWPSDDQGLPLAVPPSGEHYYAPLAYVWSAAADDSSTLARNNPLDLRLRVDPPVTPMFKKS